MPKVIARIYDPRRAEIYEKLNIPTVATTKWGVKQIQLMLLHDRKEIRESLGGGELLRLRVPVPSHLVGKPATLHQHGRQGPGRRRVPRWRRLHPHLRATLQEGDYLIVMLTKDGMDLLDELLAAAGEHH